jgi:hypothetical protein
VPTDDDEPPAPTGLEDTDAGAREHATYVLDLLQWASARRDLDPVAALGRCPGTPAADGGDSSTPQPRRETRYVPSCWTNRVDAGAANRGGPVRRAGDDEIVLTRTFTASFQLPDGEQVRVPGEVSTTSDPHPFAVGEVQSRVTGVRQESELHRGQRGPWDGCGAGGDELSTDGDSPVSLDGKAAFAGVGRVHMGEGSQR